MPFRIKSSKLLALVLLLVRGAVHGNVTGQWDFNGNLNATIGTSLQYVGDTATATLFTNLTIAGQTAQVMRFPGTIPSQGYLMAHGSSPNGGGTLVNNYTLIMDLMFPTNSTGRWRAILQTDRTNNNDAELFINPANGTGISGVYDGSVQPNVWYRLAFVFNLGASSLTKYINGAGVGSQTLASGVDGRWALNATALLFADDDNETAPGYVNSIQFHDRALSSSEIAALGAPTAAGIPLPSGGNTNSVFGQALQLNGGFENQFTNWQVLEGSPAAITSAAGKGSPHTGSRFFHGGFNHPGDAIIRQEVDLLAAGFTASDIDSGAVLDAQLFLRNWFAAGTFDDQIFCRVVYLDAGEQPLSSVRCMVAADNQWLSRTLAGLLPHGTRELQIEIIGRYRRDADNDSMADDVTVRLQQAPAGSIPPAITKLPMLQDVRTNAMTLLWETDSNLAEHAIDWGRTNVSENTLANIETLQIDDIHFVHRATIPGLQTGTRYVYRVRSGTTASATFAFRTAPGPTNAFAVAWWGDNHGGTNTLQQHVSNLMAHAPDFIAVAGDMVNSGNNISEWHNFWFKPLEHLNCAQTTPVIFARGNHDGEHALAYAYSALPGNESWFAFDYANCRFIFLDSEVDSAGSPEQFQWLQNELSRPEAQRAAFRIVCFHRPPFVNLWNGGGYTGETFVRNDWTPLFSQFGVDLVISGHAHNYNRGQTNGVTYVISGGGGGALDVQRVANWPLYSIEYSRYHFDLMEVNGDTLSWQTFDNNNQLIDMFTLQSHTTAVSANAYLAYTVPANGATGVSPQTAIEAVIAQPGNAIDPAGIELFLDRNKVTATTSIDGSSVRARHQPAEVFRPLSVHSGRMNFNDDAGRTITHDWQFTVRDYLDIRLPAPIYLETFDAMPEGQLLNGWKQTNFTDQITVGLNFNDPKSDAYRGWTVIDASRLAGNPFDPRRTALGIIMVNGQQVTALASNRLAYAESDNRSGNQEQYLYSPDFDLSAYDNIYLSYHSVYEQNQDSIGAVEYSTNGGATWLPIVYMLDGSDIIRLSDGTPDAVSTFAAGQTDTAFARPYGAFIAAPPSQGLAPFISARIDDDPVESKRVELFPLPAAGHQPRVRFRFAQAGTASWYFGIDDFGLYSIPPGYGSAARVVASLQNGQLILRWTGGAAPYQLQFKSLLDAAWQNLGAPLMNNATTNTVSGAPAFFRVLSQ